MIGSRVLAVVGLLGLMAAPGLAWADGSIAKSDDGDTGMSYNFRGSRGADAKALEECDGRCRVVYRFSGQCAAIAIGRGGGGGWAGAERQGRAEENALDQCRAQGNHGCHIKQQACDDR